MTWEPGWGCPVHKGEPYDCAKCAAEPAMTAEQEKAFNVSLGLSPSGCGCGRCAECAPDSPHPLKKSVTAPRQ